ncbi:MAG: GYD domain-containing protein [Rhodospirillales bacterium]
MAYYLFQWIYKDPQLKAMVDKTQDRAAELSKAVQGFGGRVLQFFFAFGEMDGIAIVEFPDNEACLACSLTLNAAGANASFRTTVLLSAKEAAAAMRRAHMVSTGYQPPVGYVSHG